MRATQDRGILLLGGAREAEDLAAALSAGPGAGALLIRPPGLRGTGFDTPATSLPPGDVSGRARLGRGCAAVVIATHPFDAAGTASGVAVARALGLPALRLLRPAWRPGPGDGWQQVETAGAAAEAAAGRGARRVFLAVGRDRLAPFAAALPEAELFVRVLGPGPLLARGQVLEAPGPFTAAGEAELFARLGVDLVVARNTGGAGGWPKLAAARALGLPAILLAQPAPPPGLARAATVAAAVRWISGKLGVEIPPGVA
ncbi:precorrin-6A/cobalt-precorrin-6A reductase [Paroceanicella profunda]|uniref:Precorrin-6A/cobalt-precorrin-6A reductase n=1 Tax=Paroceanicella profunda TaxID=2579971 RepID=A0A5B8FI26_9RHOB|nr:precorrin-6A/cobalt-precorrin-6A reductase [Paroceanicella profunda]QDL92608.1 precorrin-6A/cobalt-precorrin-6A reductase [Paroceanicella profunda]